MKPSPSLKRTVRYTYCCLYTGNVITHSLLAVSRFNNFSRYFTEHCAALYANLSLNYSIAMVILIFLVCLSSDNRNAVLTTDQSTIFQRAQGGLSGTEQERSGAGARSTSTRTHREISGTDRPRSGVCDSSTYTGPQNTQYVHFHLPALITIEMRREPQCCALSNCSSRPLFTKIIILKAEKNAFF